MRYRSGAVAATMRGSISLVWATGIVVGAEFAGGGLVGHLSGEVRESWFVGSVMGGTGGKGGLVGLNGAGALSAGNVVNSWAMARVVDDPGQNQSNGALIGRSFGGRLDHSWSGSEVPSSLARGLASSAGSLAGSVNYFDTSISGGSTEDVHDVTVRSVETMVTVTDADSTWSTEVWSFGDTDLSDDSADYPFLLGFEEFWPGLQAFTFASFQTENLIVATIVRSSTGDDDADADDGGQNAVGELAKA